MKITLVSIGTPHLSFAKEGIKEYTKRISRFCQFELIHIKEGKKMNESLEKVSKKKFCILLDENGKEYSSENFALFLDKQKMKGVDLCFIIGGPDGHSKEQLEKADSLFSLSQLTYPHDIATMITIETIYRSLSILDNHPYHRS